MPGALPNWTNKPFLCLCFPPLSPAFIRPPFPCPPSGDSPLRRLVGEVGGGGK